MKMDKRSGYIKYYMKIDKKNTVLFLILKLLEAAFFCVETIVVAFLLDHIITNITNKEMIVRDIVILFTVWGIKRLIEYLAQRKWIVLRKKIYSELPVQMVRKKKSLSYITMENRNTQELIKRIGNEPEKKFCEYFENQIYLAVSVIEIIGLLIVISAKNIIIGILLLIILIPYIILSIKNGQISYEAYEESEELFREAGYYKSVINNRKYLEERTLFQFGNYFNEKWSEKYKEAMKVENKANWKVLSRTEFSNVLSTLFIAGMFFAILCTSLGKALSLGFIISIMKSLINFVDEVSANLSKKMSTYEKGILFLEDMKTFAHLDKDILHNMKKINAMKEIKTVEFRNVSFAYPGSEKKVFHNLSLQMSGDKKYAIVGENGAGKSTLVKLLMGIYTNYTGDILINGVNIREFDQEELMSLFAYVPQDITKYELPLDEYLKDADVDRVNKMFAEYDIDFIKASPNQPILGRLEKESIDLSGGQWQLLAIVRASLSQRSIFILDEPTAAIDPIKEAELYSKFQKIIENKFAILITHRLGAAKMVDEIVVISEGTIVERGSHSQLVAKEGIYSGMYHTQRKWYENDEE